MKPIVFLLTLYIMSGCTENPETSEVAPVGETICQLGEGALWDGQHQRLFFIDIIGKKLFEYYPETGVQNEHAMPSMIGTVVCESKQTVLVALEDGIYRYDLEEKQLTFLACPPENDSTQRFNDGKCDPAGRFWVGTMSLKGGRKSSHLFCMDHDGEISVKLDGVTISNGIVWNSRKDRMYYIDTPTRKVMEYTYDDATGEIGQPRVAVEVPDSLGAPDGMAIDAKDRLWVCMWGGSAVCCFDPASGELVDRIVVPAKNVTSCAFSEKNLEQLYITTARVGTSEEELTRWPDAGKLFKVDLNYAGATTNCYLNNSSL